MRILILEDDTYISGFMAMSLKKAGYEVDLAQSAAEGLFLFSQQKPGLILLDLGLPDRDGGELIPLFRKEGSVPIIVVSARGQEKDKIAALDSGAEDYLTKPFSMGELLARIRVAQRRIEAGPGEPEIFSLGGLEADFTRRKIAVNGETVHLTPMEFKLLQLLIENRGKVLTHNFIMKKVWGYAESDSKNVRVFMASLRRKIEPNSAKPRFILTEVGVGYRFTDE